MRVRIPLPLSDLCSENSISFLLIEDEDYSESRTKIGLSEDSSSAENAVFSIDNSSENFQHR